MLRRVFVIGAAVIAAWSLVYAFVLPSLQARWHYDRCKECEAKLSRIARAIRDYESDNGHFPPPFSVDGNGAPLHSWRVLILPYLDEDRLYNTIHLSKPWNDPSNLAFHDLMPEAYCCPEMQYHTSKIGATTNYVAICGDRTMWPLEQTRTRKSVIDAHSDTVLIAESEINRTHWMSPVNPDVEEFIDSLVEDDLSIPTPHTYVFHIVFLDGSTLGVMNSATRSRWSTLHFVDDRNSVQ